MTSDIQQSQPRNSWYKGPVVPCLLGCRHKPYKWTTSDVLTISDRYYLPSRPRKNEEVDTLTPSWSNKYWRRDAVERFSNIYESRAITVTTACLRVSCYVCVSASVCMSSVCLSLYRYVCVLVYLSVCLCVSMCLCLRLALCLSGYLCFCIWVCLSVSLFQSVCLSVCLSLSVYLSVSVCLSVALSLLSLSLPLSLSLSLSLPLSLDRSDLHSTFDRATSVGSLNTFSRDNKSSQPSSMQTEMLPVIWLTRRS